MYRILAATSRCETAQSAQIDTKPVGHGGNQTWSWDIWLRGPKRWTSVYLYVLLDISAATSCAGWLPIGRIRRVDTRTAIEETCLKQDPRCSPWSFGPRRPMTTSARPTPRRRGHPLAEPAVSDDNPFSEAQFKTLKYHPGRRRFEDITAAIAFCRSFAPGTTPSTAMPISMLTPDGPIGASPRRPDGRGCADYSWLAACPSPGCGNATWKPALRCGPDRPPATATSTGDGKVAPDGTPDLKASGSDRRRSGRALGWAPPLRRWCVGRIMSPPKAVEFRHLWGQWKPVRPYRTAEAEPAALYEIVTLLRLGLPFKRTAVTADWFDWPTLPDLFPESFPGVKTSRDGLFVDVDLERLQMRVADYFDAGVGP